MKVPEGWKVSAMQSIGEVFAGRQVSPHFKEGLSRPYLRVANVLDGFIDYTDVKSMLFTESEFERYRLRNGDILLSEGQSLELVGRPAVFNREELNVCFQNTLVLLRPNSEVHGSFAFYLCQFQFKTGRFISIAKKTTSIAHLGVSRFANFESLIPSLSEQKKIAEILGACDEAIEAQERLIAQKQQRKKGLMQQLLTGKKRFPQFAGTPWRSVKISSLLKEVKRYVDWDDKERYQLLSLRRRSGGPFARESLLGSEIKTKTLKTVHAGDFLIAKMQVTHGALGMVTDGFDGWKVSDSYICMVPSVPDSFDVRFFNYLSQDRYIWHLAYVSSYGVAIEKMTFVLKDFLKKEISIPPTREEASAIADCIDAANEEITLQQSKLEQLKQQKKGLMQQLLTGKVRVKE